jgi:hypothetical protein
MFSGWGLGDAVITISTPAFLGEINGMPIKEIANNDNVHAQQSKSLSS